MTRERLYIGTYTRGTESEGIYRASFDTETAMLEVETCFAADNPSFLALNASGQKLHGVNEVTDFVGADQGAKSGAVTTFTIGAKGELSVVDQRPSEGALPCHLALIETHHLVVANYGGATVCVFPITADGIPEAPSHICRHEGQGPDARRQSEPHPHQVVPAGTDLVLVPDLGLDRIVCYRLRDGRLVPNDPPWAPVAPGSGPRHCIVQPEARRAYLINELDNTIDAFEFDQATGSLTHLQRVPTVPPGSTAPSACADLHTNARGRFLYGSNRGDDSIVVCELGTNGLPKVRGHVATGGAHPRNFCIDPSDTWLLAANRDSDNVVVFRLDPQSGNPEPHAEFHVPAPVCLLFA